MDSRLLRVLLAIGILFVATGAALALHACEEHHVPGDADCQVCHWLVAGAIGLIFAAIGIWLQDRDARRHFPSAVLLPRRSGRPRSAAPRAPPHR